QCDEVVASHMPHRGRAGRDSLVTPIEFHPTVRACPEAALQDSPFIYRELDIIEPPLPAAASAQQPRTHEAMLDWHYRSAHDLEASSMPSPWQVRLALQVGAPAMQREYPRSLSAIAETASAAELRGCMERLVPYAPTPVLCEFARRSAMQAETPLVRAELARLLACCGDPLDEELFARPEIPSSTALIWHGARLARVDAQGVPPALVQRVEGYLWDALREPWNEREVIVAATGILNRARSEEATDALLSLADAFEDEREWLIGALALHPSPRARSAFDRYMRAMGRDPQLA